MKRSTYDMDMFTRQFNWQYPIMNTMIIPSK